VRLLRALGNQYPSVVHVRWPPQHPPEAAKRGPPMITKQREISVSAVIFQEGNWWCAQCLEYDVATQALSLSQIRSELERVLVSHLAIAEDLQREPFFGLARAPQRFWDMYENAKPIARSDTRFRLSRSSLPPIIPTIRVA
jgi:hypothetical protein